MESPSITTAAAPGDSTSAPETKKRAVLVLASVRRAAAVWSFAAR